MGNWKNRRWETGNGMGTGTGAEWEQVLYKNGMGTGTGMGWEQVQKWETGNGSDTMLSGLFFECTNFIAKHRSFH